VAEFAEGLHLIEQAVFRGDAKAIFDGGSKLDASEAVEVEIIVETEIIADSGRSFAGDLCDECEEPVRGRAKRGCAIAVIAGAGSLKVVEPFRNGFAPDFA
jgi:hypothetical protein